MNELTDDFQNLDRVSLLWRKLTGRELSTVDYEYVMAWRDAGISFAAIRHGVQKSLRRWRPKRPNDRVKSISYCQAEILEAAARESETERGPERETENALL